MEHQLSRMDKAHMILDVLADPCKREQLSPEMQNRAVKTALITAVQEIGKHYMPGQRTRITFFSMAAYKRHPYRFDKVTIYKKWKTNFLGFRYKVVDYIIAEGP